MDKEWFKTTMRAAGLTQEKLGAKVGLDRSVVSKILNGTVSMGLDHLQGFADALGVSVADVLLHLGFDDIYEAAPSRHADAVPQVPDIANLVRLAFLEVDLVLDRENLALTRNDWAEALMDQFKILYALKYDDDLDGKALESAGQAVANNVIVANFAGRK